MERIEEFKDLWAETKGFLDLVYSDKEIQEYLNMASSVEMAVDYAADNYLAQGLGEVQE